MFRAGLLLFSTLLALSGGAAYPTVWIARTFADCNGAVLFAAGHPTVGHYQYRLRARLEHGSVSAVAGLGYRASGRVRYSFNAASTRMELPRWSWPGMTSVQRSALRDFVNALRNHEEGHWEIAQRALRRTSVISVIAPSRTRAARDLVRALAAQLQETNAETGQAEKTYDRVTDHGIRQEDGPAYGFRGGPDVTFSCR